jgi:hypothetical protein
VPLFPCNTPPPKFPYSPLIPFSSPVLIIQ